MVCYGISGAANLKGCLYTYSRSSRKRPPKMQRLGGRLRESDRKSGIFRSTKNGVVYSFYKNNESSLSSVNYW